MAQGQTFDLESSASRSSTADSGSGGGGGGIDSASRPTAGGPAPATKQNKAYLHGLRGLAALVVYTVHNIAWWYGPTGPLEEGFGYHGHYMLGTFPFLRTIFSGGAAAVAVFFVLSGYVLSLSTLQLLRVHDEHGGGRRREIWRGLVSATVRRPFRLYIPLAAVSLPFAILMQMPVIAPYMIWPKAETSLVRELWRWVKEMVKMMNPLRRYGGNAIWFRYNMAAWTMSAEFKGSLAVFALLGVYSHAPARYRFALFALSGWIFLYYVGDWVVACFMWGVCLAMLDQRRANAKSTASRFASLNLGGGGGSSGSSGTNIVSRTVRSAVSHRYAKPAFFTFTFFLSWFLLCQPSNLNPERSAATPGYQYITYHLIPYNYLKSEHWRFFNSIAATGLVYSLSHLPLLQDLLSLPTMQFLGRISFMLYLVHIPVLWTVGDRIMRLLGVQRGDFVTWFDDLLKVPDIGPMGFSTGWIISQMLIYPITAALALVLTRAVDEPSVRIGKQVAARVLPAYIRREDRIIRALHDFAARAKATLAKLPLVVPLLHALHSALRAVASRYSGSAGTGSGIGAGAGGNVSDHPSSSSSSYPLSGDVERQQGKIQ